MIHLSIIIPSYNTKQLLIDCLKSVYGSLSTDYGYEVIIIDNGSTDGTVNEIKKFQSESSNNLKLIENKENKGFAKAINQGLKEAQGKYILLLNSDTIILDDAIGKTVRFLDTHEEVGVAGCQLKNTDGSIQSSGGYLPNLFNVFCWMSFLDDLPILSKLIPAYHVEDSEFYTHERYLGWITGAFFMIRREAYEKVGNFDENIFMYAEEVDWCQRAQKQGFKIAFLPESQVIHKKGGSSGKEKAGLEEEFSGLKHYFNKHQKGMREYLLRIFLKFGALARIIVFGIIKQDQEIGKVYAKIYKSI